MMTAPAEVENNVYILKASYVNTKPCPRFMHKPSIPANFPRTIFSKMSFKIVHNTTNTHQ